MATRLALFEQDGLLSSYASEDHEEGSRTRSPARIGVAHYLAAALVLPYRAFHAAAVAAMPDGQRHLWTARTVTRRRGGWCGPGKTFAVGLGCELRHASRLVYSDGLDTRCRRTRRTTRPGERR